MRNPLVAIGDLIVSVFLMVPPFGVKIIVALFFLVLALFPFLLPKEYIFKGAPDRKRWRDIRYWSLISAIAEMIIYLYF